MPLKIIPPRNQKTKHLYIRGSYLGVSVDKSSGTHRRSVALKGLKRIEAAIENGEYGKKAAPSGQQSLTFLKAAVAYMEAGHRRRYVSALIRHFGPDKLAMEIRQADIDDAAIALHPNAGPGTRNTAVYTPVLAILHHAGINIALKRPKGAKGRVVTDWLVTEDAFGIIGAAEALDAEFAALLKLPPLYWRKARRRTQSATRGYTAMEEGRAWVRPPEGAASVRRVAACEDLSHVLHAPSRHPRKNTPSVPLSPRRPSQAPSLCARSSAISNSPALLDVPKGWHLPPPTDWRG